MLRKISESVILDYMKTIDQDIKTGELKRAYLLYGVERYLIRQYRDKLINAIVTEGDTMNFSAFEGKDVNEKEIIDLAETLPFFADRRLILIEGSGFFKKGGEELAQYLPQAPESTYFLFVEEEADKRSKMYKAVGKAGQAVEFATQSEDMISKWVVSRLKKEGKRISQEAYRLFITKTGLDMGNIDREMEKLVCYTLDREEITPQDVEEITTEQIENKIFEMVESIATHQQKKALDRYYDLLALRVEQMRILFLINRQFRELTMVKAMGSQGFGNEEIAGKVGCPAWKVNKYRGQARAFSLEQLKRIVQDGVEYEEAVKTGRMNGQVAVELFIVSCSRKQEPGGRE